MKSENKIDLSQLIISKFKEMENKNKQEYITKDYLNLYIYFLRENIGKILGKYELSQSEYELEIHENGYTIRNIFGPELKIIVTKTQTGFQIKGFVSDEEVFTISSLMDNIYNHLSINDDCYHYYVNTPERKFSYIEQSLNDTVYQGRLTPINTKHREYEIFEYTRDYPKHKRSESIIQRIIENLRGESLISIKVSSELVDVLECPDVIFRRLKDEASKLKEQQYQLKKDN